MLGHQELEMVVRILQPVAVNRIRPIWSNSTGCVSESAPDDDAGRRLADSK